MGNLQCACEPQSKDTSEFQIKSVPCSQEWDPVGEKDPVMSARADNDRILALAPFSGRWVRVREVEVPAPEPPPPRKRAFGRAKPPPPKPPPERVVVEEDMAEIGGGILTWSARYGSTMLPSEMHEGQAPGEAAIVLDGQTLFVRLAPKGGMTLRWSDGEVWHRRSGPNAETTPMSVSGSPKDGVERVKPPNAEITPVRSSAGPEERIEPSASPKKAYRNALSECYSSPQGTARPMVLEFDVRVEKGSMKLGLDMVTAKDRAAMIVAQVKPGAVKSFNDKAVTAGDGGNVIKRGDRLVEVNGCHRSADVIMNALKSGSTTKSMKMVRLLEFKLENLPNAPRGVNGFKFGEGPKGELMFAGLYSVVNKSLTPDMELRDGDYVVKVNGRSGNAEELKAEIAASDVLSLRVRRGCAGAS